MVADPIYSLSRRLTQARKRLLFAAQKNVTFCVMCVFRVRGFAWARWFGCAQLQPPFGNKYRIFDTNQLNLVRYDAFRGSVKHVQVHRCSRARPSAIRRQSGQYASTIFPQSQFASTRVIVEPDRDYARKSCPTVGAQNTKRSDQLILAKQQFKGVHWAGSRIATSASVRVIDPSR